MTFLFVIQREKSTEESFLGFQNFNFVGLQQEHQTNIVWTDSSLNVKNGNKTGHYTGNYSLFYNDSSKLLREEQV